MTKTKPQQNLESRLVFPEKSQEVFRTAAENMRREVGRNKKLLVRALKKKFLYYFETRDLFAIGYSFEEALKAGGIVRWPHEMVGGVNCFELTILAYGLAKELGFNPEYFVVEDWAPRNVGTSFDNGVGGDHACLELTLNNSRPHVKTYFDPLGHTMGTIYRRDKDSIRVKQNANTNMEVSYTNYLSLSLSELIKKMKYLRTPEGAIRTLSQLQKIGSYEGVTGDSTLYITYSKEGNEITVRISNDRHCSQNRKIDQLIKLDEDGEIESRKVYLSFKKKNIHNKRTGDERLFCVIDYEILASVQELIPGKIRKKNSSIKNLSSIVYPLLEGTGLEQLSERLGVSVEQLQQVNARLNKEFEENYQSFLEVREEGYKPRMIEEELLLLRAVYEKRLQQARAKGKQWLYSEKDKQEFLCKIGKKREQGRIKLYDLYAEDLLEYLKIHRKSKKVITELDKISYECRALGDQEVFFFRIYRSQRFYFDFLVDKIIFSQKMESQIRREMKKGKNPSEYIHQLAEKERVDTKLGYWSLFKDQIFDLAIMGKALEVTPYLGQTQRIVKRYLRVQKNA